MGDAEPVREGFTVRRNTEHGLIKQRINDTSVTDIKIPRQRVLVATQQHARAVVFVIFQDSGRSLHFKKLAYDLRHGTNDKDYGRTKNSAKAQENSNSKKDQKSCRLELVTLGDLVE